MSEEFAIAEPEAPDQPLGRRPYGLLRSGWRHKTLVVLGVVIGLVLGVLYYSRQSPVYQSSAQVLVIKKSPAFSLPGSDPGGAFDDFLATHQVLIRSPLVVGRAVQKANLRDLKSLAGLAGDPTGAVIGSLRVSREKEVSNVLNLTYRGPVADDCPVVLDALIASYQEFLETKYRNVSEETVKLISEARDVLEKKLEAKEQEYRKFRLDHPGLMRGKEGTNVLQERVINLESKKAALRIRQAELQGRIDVFEKAMKDGRPRAELLVMVSDSLKRMGFEGGKSVTAVTLEDPLTVLQLQEQSLLDKFGPEHPDVVALRRRMATLKQLSSAKIKTSTDDFVPVDPVQGHLHFLKQELEDARGMEQSLTKLLQSEQGEAKSLIGYEVQDESHRTDIHRNSQLFDSIVKRLQEINILKDFGGFDAQNIAPGSPGDKVAPRASLIMFVAGFLGLLCGLALAYAAELTEQCFRSPEEIRRHLGLPVVGHIPYFLPDQDGAAVDGTAPTLAPALCAFHHPKSREAESYRGVRTALFFNSRGHGHRIFQVTSPDMGDGKSTLAANVAISIAQAGKSVLLIDADFRRPCIHKLFSITAERGLASVIAGEAELDDVIVPSGVPGLSVLPCGPHPPNPAELLTIPRFKELLDYLRERYDLVLLDTPPLLAVTDPCVVVPHVDGVLLTIRVGKNVRPHASRAKDILVSLGAKIVGVVVNEADRYAASVYGYSGYRYGYGYAYRAYESDKSNLYYKAGSEEGANGNGSRGADHEEEAAGRDVTRGATQRGGVTRSVRSLLQRLWDRL
jgi:capsular exopolysaccharide synthesis family protein